MSKKFKGLRCAYCDGGISITVDHVFSREFFLIEDRADLPKAPACEKCNGEKSRAEHYLTAVLPIAGRHAQARTNLETNLPKRLAKNRPLARHLLTASQPAWMRQDDGIYEPTRTVQFDGSQLDRLLKYVGRGLAWHHWKVYLRPEDAVVVLLFPDASSELFHRLICGMRPEREVVEDFGNGTLRYRGVQAADPPQLTLWTISLYGGIVLSDDRKTSTGESISCTTWWVITGPKELAETFARRT